MVDYCVKVLDGSSYDAGLLEEVVNTTENILRDFSRCMNVLTKIEVSKEQIEYIIENKTILTKEDSK